MTEASRARKRSEDVTDLDAVAEEADEYRIRLSLCASDEAKELRREWVSTVAANEPEVRQAGKKEAGMVRKTKLFVQAHTPCGVRM